VHSVYLDACCFIYLVEGTPSWKATVEARLRAIAGQDETQFVTSDLTRMECRTKPLREQHVELLQQYERLLSSGELDVLPLSRGVVDRATELRAKYATLKTPDAIHLAAALVAGADLFITGDSSLGVCTELAVEVLQPTAGSDLPGPPPGTHS
jgi:predicted nucleic acid-binding protein